MNQLVGIQVIDSSNVRLNMQTQVSTGKGLPLTNLEQVFFLRSNDVVSSGKDVMCLECRSTEDRSGFSISTPSIFNSRISVYSTLPRVKPYLLTELTYRGPVMLKF